MNLQLFGNGGDREQELRNAMLAALTETTNQLASTLYTHTWKTRTTPDGNQIISLRASQAKRSAGFSPWEKTPQASDGDGGVMEIREGSAGKYKLRDFAALASWPTPQATEAGVVNQSKSGGPPSSLKHKALLASWPTPQANNAERGGSEQRATNPERSNDLHDFALLASWPTPNAMEGGQTSRSGERRDEMLMGGMVKPSPEGPARLTAFGVMLTGFAAGMDGGGQLNPALPRWLQALPPEWDASAVTAMPSTRKSPKASSKPT